VWKYVGEGNGDGGNIVTQALNNTHTTVKKNSYLAVGNNQDIIIGGTVTETAGLYKLTAGNITNVGAVQVRGTLDVTGAVKFGNTLGVNAGLNAASGSFANAVNAETVSSPNFIGPIPSGTGTAGSAGPVVSVPIPADPTKAEVKAMLDKMNILATWADPDSKFKRNAQSVQTTVTRFPTYEACPEHEAFTYKSVTGYVPTPTQADKTYEGSGGAGNAATVPPVTSTTPGSNNKEIPPESPVDSVVTKDFNMAAYQCQLKIHEGVKYVSYNDSLGLPTAGIGHLLRSNEIPMYPVPTAISEDQVNTWFNQDAPTSIKGAQELLGIDVWGDLSDVRKRACADLCYNMGKGRLSKFVRFLAGMKSGNWDLAGQSLRDSIWFKQVGKRGPNIIMMVVQNVDPNGCDKKFPP
jgi:lysozyme